MTPTDTHEAIEMLHRFVEAEVEIVKQCNRGSGKISKRAEKEEVRAMADIFRRLTGVDPTPDTINAILEV